MSSNLTPASRNTLSLDPGLTTLFQEVIRRVMISLNCHHIAVVQSFNSDRQTVTASIAYKKTVNGKQVEYPLLVDCPAVVLRGGSASLTMPIKQGDTCVMMFNDRGIDGWFQTGQIGPLPILRLHSLADGIALIGISSLLNPIQDYDPDRAVLRNGTAKIGVGETLIQFQNQTKSLKDLLEGILDLMANITTTNCVVGSPVVIFPAYKASITDFKAQVEALLE